MDIGSCLCAGLFGLHSLGCSLDDRNHHMTKSDQISHLCHMIRNNVYHAHDCNMNDQFGYVTQLQAVAAAGGFATEGTMEIMGLDKTVVELLDLAEQIQGVRNKLIANSQLNTAIHFAKGRTATSNDPVVRIA